MKLPTLNPFRALATWWRNRRPVKDAKAYGVEGAALREAIRNLTGDELAENRRAFAQRFTQFSNRQRDRWLKANGCPVKARPGQSYRQAQQAAAVAWFDRTHRGEA